MSCSIVTPCFSTLITNFFCINCIPECRQNKKYIYTLAETQPPHCMIICFVLRRSANISIILKTYIAKCCNNRYCNISISQCIVGALNYNYQNKGSGTTTGTINNNKRYIEKRYPYICFVMTMYQALLTALVSLPFCVLESWGLKKYMYKCKPDRSLSTQISDELTEVLFQGSE